jgi:hypothetical protein
MGQVKIEYSNGMVVYVNRHPSRTWSVNVGIPNGWFNYHTTAALDTGVSYSTYFNLPANNGWVVYDPLRTPYSVAISGPTHIYHPAKGFPQQVYTWNAVVAGGKTPYTYKWYWNGILAGTGSSYSRTLGFDGYYPPVNRTLRLEVTDNSVPKQTLSATKTIVEHSASDWAKISGEMESLPEDFALEQNYPNPFNPTTEIHFALPEPSDVNLTILDILGREVITLENGSLSAGYHSRQWRGVNSSGNNVGSGIYLYRIIAKAQSGKVFNKVIKMLMIK